MYPNNVCTAVTTPQPSQLVVPAVAEPVQKKHHQKQVEAEKKTSAVSGSGPATRKLFALFASMEATFCLFAVLYTNGVPSRQLHWNLLARLLREALQCQLRRTRSMRRKRRGESVGAIENSWRLRSSKTRAWCRVGRQVSCGFESVR